MQWLSLHRANFSRFRVDLQILRVLRPNECSSQNVSSLPFLSQNKCVYRLKIKTVDIFWSKTEQLNDKPFQSLYSDLQNRLTSDNFSKFRSKIGLKNHISVKFLPYLTEASTQMCGYLPESQARTALTTVYIIILRSSGQRSLT